MNELTWATMGMALLFVAKGVSMLMGGAGLIKWQKEMLYNRAAGIVLWTVAVAWTLWEVTKLGPSDFGNFKTILFVIFAGLGVASVWMLKDYLIVRALAVLVLYASWWGLKAAYLELPWTRVIFVGTIYVMIGVALWLTVAPWRVRDLLEAVEKEPKWRMLGSWAYVAWGVVLGVVAVTYRMI